MSIREIPSTDWQQFLDDFSRSHRAWLATVDACSPGTHDTRQVVDRPLQSVRTSQLTGGPTVEIRFIGESEADTAIQIQAPARLRVDETAEGTARELEITDGAGQCTRVRFRAAPRPEMLDGIAPGELSSQ